MSAARPSETQITVSPTFSLDQSVFEVVASGVQRPEKIRKAVAALRRGIAPSRIEVFRSMTRMLAAGRMSVTRKNEWSVVANDRTEH